MRLPAFPVPYEGETVPSTVARFLSRTAGPTERKLTLLGLRRTSTIGLVPPDLQSLVDAMPLGHPWCNAPDLVLRAHTLAPLYLHFAHPVRAAAGLQSLLGGQCANPAAALGITVSAAGGIARRPKFCPQCLEADLTERGSAISYREHQPEFVRLCANHATPLRLSCSNCFGDRRAASAWQTAGACECRSPSCPPVVELGRDSAADAGWLWLSRQVKFILSTTQSPAAALLPVIRQRLRASAFRARGGFDSVSVLQALEARFGRELLAEVGASQSPGRRTNQRWPGRLLGEDKLARDRLPDLVRSLLLTALVASDVAELMSTPLMPESSCADEPRGYSSKPPGRALLSRDSIQNSLALANGKITVASDLLGVRASVLVADMLRIGIRLPLASGTLSRLGAAKVEAVRRALRSGEAKKAIQSRLGVSDWTVRLLELDDPELASLHRSAAIEAQRTKHRSAITEYLKAHPKAGKKEALDACGSNAHWLRKFDRHWLADVFPKRKSVPPSKRPPVKSWDEIDLAFAKEVCTAAKLELAQSSRPVRLTTTMLLKRSGATIANNPARKHRLPLTLAAAQAHAESEDSFYKRKLLWALNEYKALAVPISTNLLRRVSGLAPAILKEQRAFIIAEASRLALSIDARCFLSPLGRPTGQGA